MAPLTFSLAPLNVAPGLTSPLTTMDIQGQPVADVLDEKLVICELSWATR